MDAGSAGAVMEVAGDGRGTGFVPPSPTVLRTREVEAEIAEVCGALNAAHARLAQLTAVALEEELWGQWGIASPSHWLRWKAGLGVAQSQAIVRVARRLGDLPETAAAFAEGRLSFDQVRVIAQYVPTCYEGAAARMATQLMVPQLASALRQYPFTPPAAASSSGNDPTGSGTTDDEPPDAGTPSTAGPASSVPDDSATSAADDGASPVPDDPAPPGAEGSSPPGADGPTPSTADGSAPTTAGGPTDVPPAGEPASIGQAPGTTPGGADAGAGGAHDVAAAGPVVGTILVPGSGGGGGAAEPNGPGSSSPPPAAEEPKVRPYLSFGFREDGSWTISGRLLPEDGALVEQALTTIRELIWNERRAEAGADGRPSEVTNIDCLLRLVDLAATNPVQPRAVKDRYRALPHLDADTLTDWEAGRRPELHLGPWLGRPIVERITCDTTVQTVLERHGHAVAFGPQHPNIPDRIRRLVERRDRSCRFPGCSHRRGIQLHHLTRRVDGGWTTEDNLICLCSRHHTDHHRGHFTITGDPTRPDGLEFRTVDGARIGGPVPPVRHPDPPTGTWEHPPGYRLERRWFQLDPDPPPPTGGDTG